MNYFHLEQMAKYNRQQIQAELKQLQLEKLLKPSQEPNGNQLRHLLIRLADWMISAGQQLHKQFDPPSTEWKLKQSS